jgi:oligopeptide transport system permease protein
MTSNVAQLSVDPLATSKKPRTLIGDAIYRFSRNRLAMFGLIVIAFFLFLAIFADVVAPYGLNEANFQITNMLPFQDWAHPLGADGIGRDYLTRLIYGARTSMLVGLLVPIIAFSFAVPLGAVAGYRGGWTDFFALRMIEVTTAVPPLLFALFLISVTGNGLENVIFVLAVTSWVEPSRIVRGQFLAYREKEFVLAAHALGANERQLIFAHILPNILSPLLVAFTFAVPQAIFAEAGLSFLGIGITEPTASWGKMVGTNVGSTIQVYYHLATFPTLLVALTMLSFSFVGDGLQEALDPGRSS